MLELNFWATLIVLASGAALKFLFDWRQSRYRIDSFEFLITSVLMIIVFNPLVAYIGSRLAVFDQVTFHENWNGWEKAAVKDVTTCTRDGLCRHTYDCDPYKVEVPYECGKTVNGKYVSKTCKREETRYHSCPYTTEEWSFSVRTTVGDYPLADRNLPTSPDNYRFRWGKGIPSRWLNDPDNVGVPQRWLSVKDRLSRNQPDPVTRRMDYDNYLLSSHSTLMKQYSGDIQQYKQQGLLPAINSRVSDLYYLNRVYFVGLSVPGDWATYINRFNAALGSLKDGDLHLVIVDSNRVGNPDSYHLALTAYWLGKDFGKDALAKNTILVIVGTKDGKTVDWVKASTGMPSGNETLLLQFETSLKGVAITPESLLGYTAASVNGGNVKVGVPDGAIAKLLWGNEGFQRVRMKNHGASQPGFEHLLKEVEPTESQKNWILFGTFISGIFAWIICLVRDGDGETAETAIKAGTAFLHRRNVRLALAVLLPVALLLAPYWIYASLKNEAVQMETTLTSLYKANQLEQDSYVKSILEGTELANLKLDQMAHVLRDAVNGRYGDKKEEIQGPFVSAVVEAYPELKGQLDVYDKLVLKVFAGRERFKNKQLYLYEQIRSYKRWLYSDPARSWVLRQVVGVPTGLLQANTGKGRTASGADALELMELVVTSKATNEAFETGEEPGITVPGRAN